MQLQEKARSCKGLHRIPGQRRGQAGRLPELVQWHGGSDELGIDGFAESHFEFYLSCGGDRRKMGEIFLSREMACAIQQFDRAQGIATCRFADRRVHHRADVKLKHIERLCQNNG